MKPSHIKFLVLLFASSLPLLAQQPVHIRVDANAAIRPFETQWAFFGYDEPNYTYAKDGRKLLSELSQLSRGSVHIRVHNLLTTGDGEAALKWGSTNAYTEDASGNPHYDWTIVDRIFDTFTERKMKPLVEIGFMPEAMSTKPQPYHHHWDPSKPYESIYTGWSYPPRDYRKWAELVYQWVKHCEERYGAKEVASWYWEVWNEPNIPYWHGTQEEYFKLYDYSADAVKRALPEIRVGGPTSTGPADPKAAKFLHDFLEHVVSGTNYATGKKGSPLDYITFHAKGKPRVISGHVQMGSEFQLQDVDQGFAIVASFPQLKHLPILLGESDPEGCAACSVQFNPQNNYRNGTIYPTYLAAIYARIHELALKRDVNFAGAVTWAFEFEDQPYFAGFRDLATNGIDKPALNLFRMFGQMQGKELQLASSGSLPLEQFLSAGAKESPDINAMSARHSRTIDVLVWNYHDDEDIHAPDAKVQLELRDLPQDAPRVLVRHYRIDQQHSNSFTAWKEMGWPQPPNPVQQQQLERAGELEMLGSPKWISVEKGKLKVDFDLPREAVSLVEVSW